MTILPSGLTDLHTSSSLRRPSSKAAQTAGCGSDHCLRRPSIDAANPDLFDLTRRVWDAITSINKPPQLFVREGRLVLASLGGSGRPPTLREMDTNLLRWWLIGVIDFTKGKNTTATRPPQVLLQNLLVCPDPPMPPLAGIAEIPMFATDGSLQSAPGYSPLTQFIYSPPVGFELPRISPKPTASEIDSARMMLLDDLFGDFPFDGESSKAHALAALLLPFVRSMIEGPTPLHLISKPKAGTGATLLAEVLCFISCGYPSVISIPRNEEEQRRTLLAALRRGPRAILLDNVKLLEGEALACCLTQTRFEDRLIGSSTSLRVPNLSLWLATGNNPELSDEITRRVLRIHLDAKVEDPDLRSSFRHPDLKRWATEQRADLIWSAVTLVQAWLAEGRPPGTKSLGKFESWSRVIGGLLDVAGVGGFLERIREFRGRDDAETSAVRGFVEAWAGKHGEQEVTSGDLLDIAGGLDLGIGDDRRRSIRLGKLLANRRGQRFGRWHIEKGRMVSGYQCWRLREIVHRPGGGGSGGGGGGG